MDYHVNVVLVLSDMINLHNVQYVLIKHLRKVSCNGSSDGSFSCDILNF